MSSAQAMEKFESLFPVPFGRDRFQDAWRLHRKTMFNKRGTFSIGIALCNTNISCISILNIIDAYLFVCLGHIACILAFVLEALQKALFQRSQGRWVLEDLHKAGVRRCKPGSEPTHWVWEPGPDPCVSVSGPTPVMESPTCGLFLKGS